MVAVSSVDILLHVCRTKLYTMKGGGWIEFLAGQKNYKSTIQSKGSPQKSSTTYKSDYSGEDSSCLSTSKMCSNFRYQHASFPDRPSGTVPQNMHPSHDSLPAKLVFAGPVCWTGKKAEIELNPTATDRTTGCGCTNFEFFQLPVATCVEKSKNRKKRV